MKPLRLMLIDQDDEFYAELVSALATEQGLELAGYIQALDLLESVCEYHDPDVVLINVELASHQSPQRTIQLLKTYYPESNVLALASQIDFNLMSGFVRAGAYGYLLKETALDGLRDTIQLANAGKIVFSPEIVHSLMQSRLGTPPDDPQES